MDKQIEKINENANMVLGQIRKLNGPNFGYEIESIKWLESFIEKKIKTQDNFDEETRYRLISTFGSFLGVCIIKNYGGEWRFQNETWGIHFDDKNAVFPFSKVEKQFENGLEDSVRSFFEVIPIVFKKILKFEK